MDELLRWREEFPILTKTTYLISNSLGAMPRAVQDRCANTRMCGPPAACAPGTKAGGRWRLRRATAWAG